MYIEQEEIPEHSDTLCFSNMHFVVLKNKKRTENRACTLPLKSELTINVSRSLGGGVSIFAEYASADYEDNTVGSSGSSVALGTTVSF